MSDVEKQWRVQGHWTMPHLPVNVKSISRRFLASVLSFKTVLQNAPENAIFIQKIENFLGREHGPIPS